MARKSKSERRRIREEQAAERKRQADIRFLSITVPVLIAGAVVTLLMQFPRPGLQLIGTTLWLGLAAECCDTFYRGEFHIVRLRIYLNRTETPRPFYLLATLYSLAVMSFATFVWLLILVGNPPA